MTMFEELKTSILGGLESYEKGEPLKRTVVTIPDEDTEKKEPKKKETVPVA